MAPNTGDAQLTQMFLNLLQDRFGFEFHPETHEAPGYRLTISPRGSKLIASTPDPTPQTPKQPRSVWQLEPREGVVTLKCPNCSMPMLAGALSK